MTNYDLYRISAGRHPRGDSVRALLLILAAALVGLTVSAAVPDHVWAELSTPQVYDLPDRHDNVAAQGPRS